MCDEATVLECVMNVSEGRRGAVVARLAALASASLLDAHADPMHHRAVLTLTGDPERLETVTHAITAAALDAIDLRNHQGLHPRLGAVDVVPFTDLDHPREVSPSALAMRDRFARWAGTELALPCFLYGPERSLPDVRKGAWVSLSPDTGPTGPHPSAGAAAVGARPVLVAFNLWLATPDREQTRRLAAALRSPTVRALGLAGPRQAQVSCNLIDPYTTGPAEVYEQVAAHTTVERAELVGLIPEAVLREQPRDLWRKLDLDPSRTIEARLEESGLIS